MIFANENVKYQIPIANEAYFAGASLLNIAIPIGESNSSPTVNNT